jgi:hypothetical protein
VLVNEIQLDFRAYVLIICDVCFTQNGWAVTYMLDNPHLCPLIDILIKKKKKGSLIDINLSQI